MPETYVKDAKADAQAIVAAAARPEVAASGEPHKVALINRGCHYCQHLTETTGLPATAADGQKLDYIDMADVITFTPHSTNLEIANTIIQQVNNPPPADQQNPSQQKFFALGITAQMGTSIDENGQVIPAAHFFYGRTDLGAAGWPTILGVDAHGALTMLAGDEPGAEAIVGKAAHRQAMLAVPAKTQVALNDSAHGPATTAPAPGGKRMLG